MSEKDALFNIRNGNVCSLCEKQLNWLHLAEPGTRPVALNNHRAICDECFKFLKTHYRFDQYDNMEKMS